MYDLDIKCLDPKRWLGDKLLDENVVVVLFLNICASYVIKQQVRLDYKIPHCFDDLFVFAIYMLRSDTQRAYHNLYLVQVSAPNMLEFDFLNSLVRYSVPENTVYLLQNLNVHINNNTETLIGRFSDKCAEYVNYCTANPNYLEAIVSISKIKLNS